MKSVADSPMTNVNIPLALFFALLYHVIQNLSKGVQKLSIEGLSIKGVKKWRDDPEKKRNFFVWVVATAGTFLANAFMMVAQPYAPYSSFVPAFSGIGLIALLWFSHWKLNENISSIEIVGAIIVVIFTFTFSKETSIKDILALNYRVFIFLVAIPLAIMFFVAVICAKKDYRAHGTIWGVISGIAGGMGMSLSQTAAISSDRSLSQMTLTWDFWVAISAAVVGFSSTQYGFKHGKASIVVPVYNAISLLIPLLVDIFVLRIDISVFQIVSFALIGLGTFLITAFRKYENPDANKQDEIFVIEG